MLVSVTETSSQQSDSVMHVHVFFFNFFAQPTNWAPQSSQVDTDPTIAQEEKWFSLKGKCPRWQDVPGAGVCLGTGEAAEQVRGKHGTEGG